MPHSLKGLEMKWCLSNGKIRNLCFCWILHNYRSLDKSCLKVVENMLKPRLKWQPVAWWEQQQHCSKSNEINKQNAHLIHFFAVSLQWLSFCLFNFWGGCEYILHFYTVSNSSVKLKESKFTLISRWQFHWCCFFVFQAPYKSGPRYSQTCFSPII